MKPSKRISEMPSETLIEALSKEIEARAAQKYGDATTQLLPRYSKKQIRMLTTELFRRLNGAEVE